MALTNDDVKRVARLARIAIDDTESSAVIGQLDGIFRLIEEMKAVDVTGVEPMSHAQDLVLRTRPDEVTEADQHAALLNLGPQVESGLYLVPKVIE